MGIAQGQIQGHIAKGRGSRVLLHQPPQPVVTINHPEVSGLATHQGGGFLAQVPPPLLGAVLGEIPLATTDLRHAHTHLGGAQGGKGNFQQLAVARGWRQGLERGESQGHSTTLGRLQTLVCSARDRLQSINFAVGGLGDAEPLAPPVHRPIPALFPAGQPEGFSAEADGVAMGNGLAHQGITLDF